MGTSTTASKLGGAMWACLLGIGVAGPTAQAQVVREIKDIVVEDFSSVAIDRAGSVIYAVATSNQYGTNPGHRRQIFRWDAASGVGEQLTSFEEGVLFVSVSDDGQWLAFVSNGNLTGANHDESAEVFVMHPDGSGLAQLTNDVSLAGDGAWTASISGSGHRVAFTSDVDPLGTNPSRTPHLFVVDRDGGNLSQVADIDSVYTPQAAAISDDGNRIAFLRSFYTSPGLEIFSVPADGSTPASIVATGSSGPGAIALSGNGRTILFQDGSTIFKVNWDGTGPVTPVASGASPTITDDGQTVVYANTGSIWKVGIDGTGASPIASGNVSLAVSGDGTRVAVQTLVPSDYDFGDKEHNAMDASGGSLHQLTSLTPDRGGVGPPRILANGSRIYFLSNKDLVGSNASHATVLFVMNVDGSGVAQVFAIGEGRISDDYTISDSGLVVFETRSDLTGQNTCHVFQVFKVNTNGTGLTQVTGCGGNPFDRVSPQVLYNGQYIVYQGEDRVGSNTDGSPELFRVAANGTGLTPITADNDDLFKYPRLSASTGIQYVVYNSGSNVDGLNPHGLAQVFRVPLFGTTSQRVTGDPDYASADPDVSGDGNTVVWWSQADFVGSNPNHKGQIFLWDASTSLKRQLTNTTKDDIYGNPRISRDGAWVTFGRQNGLARVSVATGAVQRVSGFEHGNSFASSYLDVDSGANHTVFIGEDVIDRSPSTNSIFLADQTIKPQFVVGKSTPTLLTWDPDPDALRYDVIRGDLAQLAIVTGAVNLGPVVCLEDDSPDNQTLGNEDTSQPTPGQAFFYLYRGTTGIPPVTGSWGQGTGARERVAGVGSCNP